MAKIPYSSRILVDYEFLSWMKTADDLTRREIAQYLLRIKASSFYHKGAHCVILKNDFEKADSAKLFSAENLMGLVKPMEKPDFITGKDEVGNIIKFAEYLANQPPFETTILTSPEKYEDYMNNPHYQLIGGRSVVVKHSKEAHVLLRSFFQLFTNSRPR